MMTHTSLDAAITCLTAEFCLKVHKASKPSVRQCSPCVS